MLRSSSIMLAALAFCLMAMTGCSKSVEDKLVGKWELDTQALQDAMKEEMAKKTEGTKDGMEDFGAKMMESMVSMFASMKLSMEFQKDGKLIVTASMMGQEKKDEGTWKVVKVEGNKITLRMSDGKEKDEENTITLVNDDTLEIYPPEGQAPGGLEKMTLRRVK